MNRNVRRTVLAQLKGKLSPAEIQRLDATVKNLTPAQLAEEIRRRKAELEHPELNLPIPRAPHQH